MVVRQGLHLYLIISYEEVSAAQTVKCRGNSLKLDLQCFYFSADANLALASLEAIDVAFDTLAFTVDIDVPVDTVFAMFSAKTAPRKCLLYHICKARYNREHALTHKEATHTHTHTHKHWALLVPPDKSLSTVQCLCTSQGAEGEWN